MTEANTQERFTTEAPRPRDVFDFAILDNWRAVRISLDSEALDVNAQSRDWRLWTLLHFAVSQKDLKAVKMLVRKRAKINCVDERGKTPLDYCTRPEHEPIKQYLLLMIAKNNEDSKRISCTVSDPKDSKLVAPLDRESKSKKIYEYRTIVDRYVIDLIRERLTHSTPQLVGIQYKKIDADVFDCRFLLNEPVHSLNKYDSGTLGSLINQQIADYSWEVSDDINSYRVHLEADQIKEIEVAERERPLPFMIVHSPELGEKSTHYIPLIIIKASLSHWLKV